MSIFNNAQLSVSACDFYSRKVAFNLACLILCADICTVILTEEMFEIVDVGMRVACVDESNGANN